jgi:hypothetical protein
MMTNGAFRQQAISFTDNKPADTKPRRFLDLPLVAGRKTPERSRL